MWGASGHRVVPWGTLLLSLTLIIGTRVEAQVPDTASQYEPQFMDIKPDPQWIFKKRILGADIHEWTLDNGIRVLLRQVPNAEGRISIHGSSVGGYYRYSVSNDLIPGLTALDILNYDILRGRTEDEAARLMRGKQMAVTRYLRPYTEGVTLDTRWKDLEAGFQFLWVTLWEVRINAKAYDAYRARLMNGRIRTPDEAFQDTIRLTMAQHHPLVVKEMSFRTNDLDTTKSQQIYHRRFGQMGDFLFVIAGDFAMDSIAPLIEQYLGPYMGPRGHYEAPFNPGITPPKGLVRKTVRGRADGKSTTLIKFYGTSETTQEAFERLRMLREFLRFRFEKKLASSADSIDVRTDWTFLPTPSYSLDISLTTRPEQTERVVQAVLEEIRQLHDAKDATLSSEFTSELTTDFRTIHETYLRQFRASLLDEKTWVDRIFVFENFKWPLASIASDSVIAGMTAESIPMMTRQFLDLKNFARFDFVPNTSSQRTLPINTKVR